MLTVYGMKASGNCYKIELLLEQLSIAHRWVEIDSTRGETRTPEYLAMNANGKVPLLQADDGRFLAESNAILCYLADVRTCFRPIAGSALKRCNGCSSSNTATSLTSLSRVSSVDGWTPTICAAPNCPNCWSVATQRWT